MRRPTGESRAFGLAGHLKREPSEALCRDEVECTAPEELADESKARQQQVVAACGRLKERGQRGDIPGEARDLLTGGVERGGERDGACHGAHRTTDGLACGCSASRIADPHRCGKPLHQVHEPRRHGDLVEGPERLPHAEFEREVLVEFEAAARAEALDEFLRQGLDDGDLQSDAVQGEGNRH